MGCCQSTKLSEDDLSILVRKLDVIDQSALKFVGDFCGVVSLCKVISVYDGDTVTIIFLPPNSNTLSKATIRLLGIDAPEIRVSKTDPNYTQHKLAGTLVRDKLLKLTHNKICWIKFYKNDKYGRCLGTLYPYLQTDIAFPIGRKSINDAMLDVTHSYDGTGQRQWTYAELNNIISQLNIDSR